MKREVRYITQCQQCNPDEKFISPQRQAKPHQKKQPAGRCTLRLHVPSLLVSLFPTRSKLFVSPCAEPQLKSRATSLDPEVSELSQFRLARLVENSYTRKATLPAPIYSKHIKKILSCDSWAHKTLQASIRYSQ